MSGRKGSKHLTRTERVKLEALYSNGKTVREIADYLNRDKSTIYKELKRGYWERMDSDWKLIPSYSADIAQQDYNYKASGKGAPLKIGKDFALANYLEEKIVKEKYSPCAALAEIKKQRQEFQTAICFKTLYNYIDSKLFQKLSNKHLPRGKYRKKEKRKTPSLRLRKPLCRSIEERPRDITCRQSFGHWEMDTVVGKQRGKGAALLVLTERLTRQEIIMKMPRKTAANTVKCLDALERRCGKMFKKIFKSITVDNGGEFMDTDGIERSCRTKGKRTTLYYCHPYSSWERGSNEHANSLIRRFIPKGTSIDKYTPAQIKKIETWMNRYPRKILNYECSEDVFMRHIAMI